MRFCEVAAISTATTAWQKATMLSSTEQGWRQIQIQMLDTDTEALAL
ncbi:MAG: hypothetical protein ACRCVX_16175 [Shewanella sp.]